jgi:hypothetical protein
MSPATAVELSDLDLFTAGRWILGHQTFHVQLVAMLSVLDLCQRCLAADDQPLLVRCLGDLRMLFDASTANMIYTASFSPELYTKAVRPTMMPPFLSPGFSGQLSREHGLLMEDLGHLGQALQTRWGGGEAWPVEVAEAWRQIEAAIQRNRQHHGLVCQRFVPGGSSLLIEFLAARAKAQGRLPKGEARDLTHGGESDDRGDGDLAPQTRP